MANVAWLVNAVTGAPEYSGRAVRQAMSVALGGATAARPLGARSGVRPGTPASTVALPTATSYVIHPHAGVLDLQTSALAGPYLYVVGSDGVDETGTVNAAHGTWPRKDILWVRVDDPAEEGTDPPLVVTGYTAGTAAASPAVPATPARSMRLATISVPLSGGGAPTIVWDAPLLEAGIPFAQAAGSASVGSSAAPLSNSVAVTFPTGRFTVAPEVFAQSVETSVTTDPFLPMVDGITATGFNLRLYRVNGAVWSTARTAQWHAVQMLSTAAAG